MRLTSIRGVVVLSLTMIVKNTTTLAKLAFASVIFISFSISFYTAHAQTTTVTSTEDTNCGSIINPNFGSSEPIEDCDNPFGAVDHNVPTPIEYNDITIEHGTDIQVPSTEYHRFTVDTTDYRVSLYRKSEAGDYVFIRDIPGTQYLDDYTDAQTIALEEYFFFEVKNLEINLMQKLRDDPGSINDVQQDLIAEFNEYVEYAQQFETGDYVLVFESKGGGPVLSQRNPILNLIFPIAHAQVVSPGSPEVHSVSFTVNGGLEQDKNPPSILFLPGIKGSRLYTERAIGTEDRLWEPTLNQDVSQLEMTENGESINEVYTREIIDTVFRQDIYNNFLNYLEQKEEEEIISGWRTFPYDWRYSVRDVVENGTQYEDERRHLIEAVEKLASSTDSKVTIVAHSNGGLLAKALLKKLEAEGKSDLVERVVFLGTPQLGTPKAIGSMLHGYDEEKLGGLIVDDNTARDISRNMPGGYTLLPSQEYVDVTDSSLVSFDDSDAAAQFRDAYGADINTYAEFTAFLNGDEGRNDADEIYEPSLLNSALLADASAYHDNTLDDWTAPEDVEVIEMVGVGHDTVRGFRYEEFTKEECLFGPFGCREVSYLKPVPQFTKQGDNTVIADSADAYPGESETYYIDLPAVPSDGIAHFNLTESESVQESLSALLTDETLDVPAISTSKPSYDQRRDVISVHSPVALSISDEDGHEVGVVGEDEEAHVVTEIPGSSYIEIAGSKYTILPADTEYEVSLDGESSGDYTVRIDLLDEDDDMITEFTHHGKVTNDLEASFKKTEEGFTPLEIDENGDGETDNEVTIEEEEDDEQNSYTYADLRAAIKELDLHRGRGMRLLLQVRGAKRFSEFNNPWMPFDLESRMLSRLQRTIDRYERRGVITKAQKKELDDIINSLK